MQLSKNFALHEFVRSQTASRHQINNTPPHDSVVALTHLVANLLQPLRDFLGRPITITSGFRCFDLNQRIGGSQNSQHMVGEAADFECWGISNPDLFRVIRNRFVYDQLILERHNPAHGPHSGWIHLSYRVAGPNRMQAFRDPTPKN